MPGLQRGGIRMEGRTILYLAGAVAAGVALFSGDDAEAGDVGEEEMDPQVGAPNHPQVGFAPAVVELPRGYSLPPRPMPVEEWEQREPTVGHFYQVQRGDMLLGHGKKSITWMALYRASHFLAVEQEQGEADSHRFAKIMADNANNRCEYAHLILAGSWNDQLYGTWGYGKRDFTGHHGRGIPLSTCHADNRARMLEGEEPVRQIEPCCPADKGSGAALVNGLSRPYLWLPLIDLDALLDGRVTTDGVVWGASAISGLEPPPTFWRM